MKVNFLLPFFFLAFSLFSHSRNISFNLNHLIGNSIRPPSMLIDGPQNVCRDVNATYEINPVSNATSYDWTLPNGWIGSSIDNTISVIVNETSGTVLLTVNRSSGGPLLYAVDVVVSMVNASFISSPEEISTFSTNCIFTNNSSDATNFYWDFGDGDGSSEENPTHLFPDNESGLYKVTLIAFSEYGCLDSLTRKIKVKEDLLFYVPNSFTPDGDKFNEIFRPVFTSGYDPYNFKLIIYDRKGKVIFESNDASIGWDGGYGTNGFKVAQGIYNWKINYVLKETAEQKSCFGHVCLLR